MTASEAIEWLTDIIDEATRNEESVYYARLDDADALNTAIEALKRNQWTPCNEGLPEEYGEYLITWTTSQSKRPFVEISEGEVTDEYDYEHNRFKFKWLMEDFPNVEVIAWMPLPEPWKGEEDDKVH